MRKIYFVCALALCVTGANALTGNVIKAGIDGQAEPGTRCTRLRYGPKATAKETAPTPGGSTAQPGSRCLRLSKEPRQGEEFLPNKPPKVGLSSSTSYLGPDAGAEIKLKTIACDLDDDSLLYTYSATAGHVRGDGADAVWDLNGVSRPGDYVVMVEVDDGCGCISFADAIVSVK